MKANSMDKSKSKNPNPLVKLLGKCIAPDFFILFYDTHNLYFYYLFLILRRIVIYLLKIMLYSRIIYLYYYKRVCLTTLFLILMTNRILTIAL